MSDPNQTSPSESMDMSMRADANVQWANPDALTREMTIRCQALGAALGVSRFGTVPQLLEAAEEIGRWITDGTRGA